jgi:predicted tellurium resistance membrane protein TerC
LAIHPFSVPARTQVNTGREVGLIGQVSAMLTAVVDRYKQIVTWAAVLIGAAAEALLIWMIDQLPLWAQVLVYAPGAVGIVGGVIIIWRDRSRARQRKRLAAE